MSDGSEALACPKVGVGCIVVNKEKKILCCRRSHNVRNERDKWAVLGGVVELWETLEDAVGREVKEETGIDIKIVCQIGAIDHILKNETQHWVAVFYLCEHLGGMPTIIEKDKMTYLRWLSFDDVMSKDLSDIARRGLLLARDKKLL
jgi:ADP-ribose pyrophosphatase YjhB (NUDIX family)